MREERLPVLKTWRRYWRMHNLEIYRAARIGQDIEMIAMIMQAIFAPLMTRGDTARGGVRGCGRDKPYFACGVIMRANLDIVPAIALPNRDEKSRIVFFIDQARLGHLIVNVFGKNRIGALIIVALHPK